MHPKTMTMVFMALLAQRNHDREVISRYVSEGKIDQKNLDPAVWSNKEVAMDKEELLVSTFETGITEEPKNKLLREVREIRDILENSVRKHFNLPEVQQWLLSFGETPEKGLAKLDEKLVTRERLRAYKRNLKALKRAYGEIPTPLGQATHIEVDSATNYSGYAVEAHRLAKTRKAYGEVHDPDEEITEKDWRVDQYDTNLSADMMSDDKEKKVIYGMSWWKGRVAIGRKKVTCKKPKGLKQIDKSYWRPWTLDLRLGEVVAGRHFRFLEKIIPVFQIEDHPIVREFVYRFYNQPETLEWTRQSFEKDGKVVYGRWCAGMATPMGQWLWCPVNTKGQKNMAYFKSVENGTYEKKPYYGRKAILFPRWIVTFQKDNKIQDNILVTYLRECTQTGWYAPFKKLSIHWKLWYSFDKQKQCMTGLKVQLMKKPGAKLGFYGKTGEVIPTKEKVDVELPEGYVHI